MSQHTSTPSLAASICRLIERRSADLGQLDSALAEAPRDAGGIAWGPREILLHLIGAVSEHPRYLAMAGSGDSPFVTPAQLGGVYTDIDTIETAHEAAAVLRTKLDALNAALVGLEDEALQRPVTMAAGDGQVSARVPVGLLVRYGLTSHFDEHLLQLREALGLDSSDASA